MCVADVPVPVIVIGYVPAAVPDVVETVSVEELPAVTEVGLKPAVMPAGSPDADSATVCAEPEVTAVLTVVGVELPAVTVPEVGLTEIEKSLVTTGLTVSEYVVLCVADVPVPVIVIG